jgi:hypothetical protein
MGNKIVDWDQIKREYFAAHLSFGASDEGPLKGLAKKYNISYGSLKNRSSKEGWKNELILSKNKIHKKVSSELIENKVLTELEVRRKNYDAADLCLDKGVEKLLRLADGEFTPEIIIKLIQLGMKGRSDSTGISNKIEVSGKLTVSPEEDNFLKDFQSHRKNKNLLQKLTKYLGGNNEKNEEGMVDI